MAAGDWHFETTTRDSLVLIDDTPLWVRVQSIEAIRPDTYPDDHRTVILLSSGQRVYTDVSVEDVIGILTTAMRNATPTFGGKT